MRVVQQLLRLLGSLVDLKHVDGALVGPGDGLGSLSAALAINQVVGGPCPSAHGLVECQSLLMLHAHGHVQVGHESFLLVFQLLYLRLVLLHVSHFFLSFHVVLVVNLRHELLLQLKFLLLGFNLLRSHFLGLLSLFLRYFQLLMCKFEVDLNLFLLMSFLLGFSPLELQFQSLLPLLLLRFLYQRDLFL